MTPFISVIMPVYNNARYVSETIESVLGQTYENFEFIIIDDCSTDESWATIQEYAKKDKRIKAYRNERNLKIAKTRNTGFSKAAKKAKYYAIIDSDDVAMPERLEKEVSFLEKNRPYALVGSDLIIIDEKGKERGRRTYPHTWERIRRTFTTYNPVAQPAAMIRADALRKGIRFYDERYTRCQDYDLWFRIAAKHRVANIPEPLLKYRISSTQGKTTHLKETVRFTREIQRKWLFKKRFITARGVVTWLGTALLPLLPNGMLLPLFKRTFYK